MSLRLPPLPPVQPPWGDFQVWWQQIKTAIEDHETTQDEVLTALLQALANMPDLAPITITADYTGTVDPADQLPYYVAAKRYSGDSDVTTLSAWSLAVTTGSCTASIDAATGVITITAVTSSSVLTITSVYQGVSKSRLLSITKTLTSAPASGGGGSGAAGSSSDNSFDTVHSATHAAISDELTVTVGSAGVVTLTAPLEVLTARTAPTGTFKVYGKWQWWDGAAWVDLAAEVPSSPDCVVGYDPEFSVYTHNPGVLSVPDSKTGLAAASSQKFRLLARNNTGNRPMSFSGTASAVAS